ncbi:hypothetical protein PR048_030040 [Dryococelus australis]|uniref:Uncharacterized protein n=1 Tax=Dryococelus australis TaxID=614101 RepID=A0ABQ9GAK3_9NEOP|nr:hypothetical protein PR048_030040 [Dryococelus australis]
MPLPPRTWQGATVPERLARSPPTKSNRAQSPAGSPDFCKWDSCRTMPLVRGFSRGSPVSHAPSFRLCSVLTLITFIGSQDLAVKSRPNLFTRSLANKLGSHTMQIDSEQESWLYNPLCPYLKQTTLENGTAALTEDSEESVSEAVLRFQKDPVTFRKRETFTFIFLSFAHSNSRTAVVYWLDYSLPPRRTEFDSLRGLRWLADLLGGLPFPPPLHSSAAQYSHRFTLIGSEDLDVKSRPNLSTHSGQSRGRIPRSSKSRAWEISEATRTFRSRVCPMLPGAAMCLLQHWLLCVCFRRRCRMRVPRLQVSRVEHRGHDCVFQTTTANSGENHCNHENGLQGTGTTEYEQLRRSDSPSPLAQNRHNHSTHDTEDLSLRSSAGTKWWGKREIPEKNPPTNVIAQHDTHVRKSGSARPGIEPGSPWWEVSRLTAQPPRPLSSFRGILKFRTCEVHRQPRQVRSELDISTTAGTPVYWSAALPLTTFLLANMTTDTPTVLYNTRYWLDKIDVKHVYTEVDFVIGSQFIRYALDDCEPIADFQGNKRCPFDLTVAQPSLLWRWRLVVSDRNSRKIKHRHFPRKSVAILSRGLGGRSIRLLASYQGEPGLIPDVGRFSRGSPVSPALSFRRCSILTSFILIGAQDLAAKSCPNIFTSHTHHLESHLAQLVQGLARQLLHLLVRHLVGSGYIANLALEPVEKS